MFKAVSGLQFSVFGYKISLSQQIIK